MTHHHPPRNVTLKGYRKAWMLTEQEVAERMGVSRQTIAAWEDGTAVPTSAQVARLARVYRLALEDILPAVEAGGGQ